VQDIDQEWGASVTSPDRASTMGVAAMMTWELRRTRQDNPSLWLQNGYVPGGQWNDD